MALLENVDFQDVASEPSAGPACGRTSVLGVGIDRLNLDQMLSRVLSLAETAGPHLVCYANADCLNRAAKDKAYRHILRRAAVVYADGMSVVWASRLTHEPLPRRLTLGEVWRDAFQKISERGLRVYLLGGKPGVSEKAAEQLRQLFPNLQIAGQHHGFFSDDENEAIVGRINESRPDILMVGMGSPRQEKWLWNNRKSLRVSVRWGVGAALEYAAGVTRQAPPWMRRFGLEWFFRFLLEPRRLWRRYLLGNVLFVLKACRVMVADAVLIAAAWLLAYGVRLGVAAHGGAAINPIHVYLQVLPLLVGIWLFICAGLGMYRRQSTMRLRDELSMITGATVLGLVMTIAAAFILKELDVGRSVVLLFGPLAFVFMFCSRLAYRALERHEEQARQGRRALVIGPKTRAEAVSARIEDRHPQYEFLGFVSYQAALGRNDEAVGSIEDIDELIKTLDVDDLFVADETSAAENALDVLESLPTERVDIHIVTQGSPLLAKQLNLQTVGDLAIFDLPKIKPKAWYDATKRLLDVAAALSGLLLALPWCWLIAVIIKLESPGAALFVQDRVGWQGRRFRMFKFRTMTVDASPYALSPNDLTDPRVTRFGRFLRRWSLDELPQLINVLLGDMSLIGPRPEMPFLVERYAFWEKERLLVKPGLTCLWQVCGRKELPLHTNLEYDVYYVRHRGWRMDLSILIRTLPAVISRRGAF